MNRSRDGGEYRKAGQEPLCQCWTRAHVPVCLSSHAPVVQWKCRLISRLDPIRIEVNFAMPLIAQKGERLARGFGIGVGLEFL